MSPRINVRRAAVACCVVAVACTTLFSDSPRMVAADAKHSAQDDRQKALVPLAADARRRFRHDFRTWQELKEHHVVMQQQDYSCGAAALATVAQYYFRDNVTEERILDQLLNNMTIDERKDREENGLSMDDLFEAAKALGYQATVYPLKLAKLKELQAPIVVRIIKDDYKHFVVVRGVVDDRIYLADPIRGNVRVSAAEFARQWNGVALFLGKTGFGLPAEHGLSLKATKDSRPELQPVRRAIERFPARQAPASLGRR